jgi:hypothetical protein
MASPSKPFPHWRTWTTASTSMMANLGHGCGLATMLEQVFVTLRAMFIHRITITGCSDRGAWPWRRRVDLAVRAH